MFRLARVLTNLAIQGPLRLNGSWLFVGGWGTHVFVRLVFGSFSVQFLFLKILIYYKTINKIPYELI